MPVWLRRTPREDSVVGSTVHALFKEAEEKSGTGTVHKEMILANELIRLSGTGEYIDKSLFDRSDPRLPILFEEWLYQVETPTDPGCHVRGEDGSWIADDILRTAIASGGRLHIPTRTLSDGTWVTSMQDLIPRNIPETSQPESASTPPEEGGSAPTSPSPRGSALAPSTAST